MADNIQFRVDAVLGDTQQLQSQINNLKTNLTLSIDNQRALQSIRTVQQQVDALRNSMANMPLNIGGGVNGNNGMLGGAVNNANMLQRALQGTALQFDRITTRNGQLVSTTERLRQGYTDTTHTLQRNGDLITTIQNNHNQLQRDIDNFNKKNLNAIDFEIQKREQASQRFSQQIKSQMEAQAQQQQALNRLGMETGTAFDTSTITDITSLESALSSINIGWDKNTSSVTNFKQRLDETGNTITQFTVRQRQIGTDGKEVWKNVQYAVSTADGQLRKYGETSQDILNVQMSGFDKLIATAKSYISYMAVQAVWQGISNGISDCINYAKDLDQVINNIRVVTMDTQSATEDLVKSYNEIGQRLGASTLDVAEGAVDWLRQGFSEADTSTLVEDSVILSKLALIDNAEATEYLTSALKGYKLEASDALGIIDQLVAIDLEAATSSADLAEAMSRTANMARTTGFEMNELLGMIATMSEVTQMSASTVGNSVKTLLSRMSNVKAGVEIDPESGEALNDVEKVLSRMGIALRDNQGEWRDFYEVLDEVANRWEDFSSTEQSQITTALGGTRQRENVLVALENWDKVKQYAQTGAEATGTAMEKYDIVLESISAKQAQLQAKVEAFYSSILNGGLIAGLVDMASAFMSLMNLGDGLVGKLSLVTVSTIALSFALQKLAPKGITSALANLITGFFGVKVAEDATTASSIVLKGALDVLKAHPLILALSALIAVFTIGKHAIDQYNESIQESIDNANELTDAYKSNTSELNDNINSLSTSSNPTQFATLADEFEMLTKGVDTYGNNISLTSDQYERYKAICQQIIGLNPDLMKGYNSETEAIGNKNSVLQATIDLLKQQQREEAKKYADSSNEVLEGSRSTFTQDTQSAQQTIDAYQGMVAMHDQIIRDVAREGNTLDEYGRVVVSVEEKVAKATAEKNQYIQANAEAYSNAITTLKGAEEDFARSMDSIYSAVVQSTDGADALSGSTKHFLNQYISENFTLDPYASEKEQQEAIKAYKDEIKKLVGKLAKIDTPEGQQTQFAINDFFKLDIKETTYSEYKSKLQNAIDKIAETTGLDKNTIQIALEADIDTSKFDDLDGLTDKITKGFGKQGKELDKAKGKVKDYLSTLTGSELDKARFAIANFGDEIHNLGDLQDAIARLNDVDYALNGVSEGFTNASIQASQYTAKMKALKDGDMPEYDTDYNTYVDAVDQIEEAFKNGTTGSLAFQESVKHLLGEDFDVTNVDAVHKKLSQLKKLFSEDNYGEGMLKQLRNVDLELSEIKKNSDGTWDFDIDTSKEGIEELAEALGITEEAVWATLKAMQMRGEINLFDNDKILDTITTFGELDTLLVKNGDNIKEFNAIDVQGLKDQLTEAGISTANLDEALAQLAEKGYVLLDTSSDAETLKNSLSQLSLVAENGSVDVGKLVESLTTMGYSKDQIATMLQTLSGLDGISFTNLGEGVVNVQAKIDGLKSEATESKDNLEEMKTKAQQFDQVSLTTIQTAIDNVKNKLTDANTVAGKVITSLNKINGERIVTITYKEVGKPAKIGGTHGLNGIGNGRTYLKGSAFGRGDWGAKRTETALTGEVAPEIWVHADTGKWELITNPQFVRVKKGDVIFNGKQTRDLLAKGFSNNFGSSFLGGTNGTAYFSATGWGSSKKYPEYTNKNSKTLKDSSKSKSSSEGKEWWEESLERLKDDLDYNAITMDTYINGLNNILGQLKKGSDAWKEINKELQEAKLENVENQFDNNKITIDEYISKLIELRKNYKKNSEGYKELTQTINEAKLDKVENQFDRGEITIDQYISKLGDLRQNYKKNSEGYKELTQTINEAKADKFADQYERGEISLNSYVKQLGKLRDSYKKNSEEWKEYNDLIKETKLDSLEKQFNNGEISITQYINGLKDLRKNYKKNSDEYKELTQTINDTRLDNVENQFDRGEITISQYISKLTKLRDSYDENSEKYKELTQTINETKADKYADQYERGEISLKTYIKQLTKLRDSYKENSEEWKKYNDLIIDSKLEAYFEKLTKAVEKYDNAMANLGNVNTDKERVKYAELLIGKYNKTLEQIEELREKLKDTSLTEKEREQYQEELNNKLQEEVSIRDEIEDSVREYYENQKQQAEQQAELTRKQTLYNKEVELYGKQGKEIWEYNNNKQIEALEKQVEARRAEKEALDEINEREELENNLLQARLNLQNALNSKTTKVLTKQADGTWAYTFSANMADVKSATEEVESAQKDLDDFDWEQETKVIESQIDELNKTAEELADQYSDAEFWADREYEQTMNSIARAFGDIDGLVEKWFETYGGDTETLTNAYQSLTTSNNSLIDSLVQLAKKLDGYYETVGTNGKITPKDGVKSFDTGGDIVGTGLAFVHNKKRVLTQEQNANFKDLLNNIEVAKKLIDVSKVNIQTYRQMGNSLNNQQEPNTVIQSVTCNFPNITTTDGLQQAILDLPRIALQRK